MTKGNYTSNLCVIGLLCCYCSSPDVSCKQFSGFGKSLLARYIAIVFTIHSMCEDHYSVSDKYLSDFALHGTTEKDFSEKLYDDLKAVIKVQYIICC